jgi:hypothetical protein
MNDANLRRCDIMGDFPFPANAPNVVYIKSNDYGTGFLRTSYDKDQLSSLISKKDFIGVIDKTNNLLVRQYSRNRNANAMQTPMYIKITYYIAFALLLTYFALNFYNEDLYLWYDLMEFGVLALAVVIVMFVTCTNYD